MPAPVGNSSGRFALESHAHDGSFITSLPYANIQSEAFLGTQGQQLRVDIPYRNYSQVTPDNLYPGKHELWLFDYAYSLTDPLFAGPVWDCTASSSTGVVNCSAQDPLSYLAKRELRDFTTYNDEQPADIIVDLMNYVNTQYPTIMTGVKMSDNAKTVGVTWQAADYNKIKDLIDKAAAMGDGVDYYFRTLDGQHVLRAYGGKIAPPVGDIVMEYGGSLDGYSNQYNAQRLANDYAVVGSNGIEGRATNVAKQTEYQALYMDSESGSDLSASTSLADAAATELKSIQSTDEIPSITTHLYSPVKDFDFGSQFRIVIDDGYVQYDQVIRAVGWQLTIGGADNITTVIYTNDTEEVD